MQMVQHFWCKFYILQPPTLHYWYNIASYIQDSYTDTDTTINVNTSHGPRDHLANNKQYNYRDVPHLAWRDPSDSSQPSRYPPYQPQYPDRSYRSEHEDYQRDSQCPPNLYQPHYRSKRDDYRRDSQRTLHPSQPRHMSERDDYPHASTSQSSQRPKYSTQQQQYPPQPPKISISISPVKNAGGPR
ncbi:hypothetical protein BT96DRAFT_998561 [Gymnopus androsaceus JB14]|uniref:Uncharacterized protein n=1 Tax=Gymnopus androsaceus JB14 TaxID=1447944 RepID=A0A6A4H9R4_9AGAR|nr:hypothetical protein BT96DRAFT_998561 [Gymnopus androsaceus JB14]